ncbi:MAG: N-acetylmuramoyl-L-alanine amidase, partial [Bacteroidia bacterium]|nr:N-acetylmuramoyl-L-alanine amidase [Bacteroidia bacterium]
MFVLIDPGHGGMINGVYQTAGKRSPKWGDLPQLFEGVQNRKIAAKLKELLKASNIPFMDVVDSESDVSLGERVRKANAAFKQHPDAIYISIHADAAGDGVSNHPAKGFSIWTSKGESKSDRLAEAILLELAATMSGRSS